MFNLEQSITDWRKSLEKHPGLEPGYIEELESHLSDEIDHYLSEGYSPEEAFQKAADRQFETVDELASEYFRARSTGGQIPPWKRSTPILTLLPNFVKVALRNLKRNKLYSTINIAGMAVGIACCLVLLGYVGYELSYDRFHENADRIYRVNMRSTVENQARTSAQITAAIGPDMAAEFPEVIRTVRLSNFRQGYFTYLDRTVNTGNISYADSTLFSVFSFRLLQGRESEALTRPGTVVISRKLAGKLFPRSNPVGKTITLNGTDELEVTGIIENPPSNSQLNYSALISFNSLYDRPYVFLDWNGGWSYYTYVLLDKNADPAQLTSKFPPFMDRHINDFLEDVGVRWDPELQPLTEVHLYSDVQGELATKGSLTSIYLFSITAFIILLLACINFINLTTVQASGRSKEIGIRKASGGARSGLAAQFMLESAGYILISLLAALILLLLFKPGIDQLVGTDILQFFAGNGYILALTAGLLFVTMLVSGAYPSLFLSSLNPSRALKEKVALAGGPVSLIRSLVVFQFAVSVLLIAATLVVFRQLDYIKNRELGYNKENVVVLPLIGDEVQNNYPLLNEQLRAVPGVQLAAGSSDVPGNGFTSNGYFPEGHENPMMINVLDVDPEYFATMGIEIVQGRNFSEELQSDRTNYLVNRALADKLGWEDPVGKTIQRNGEHKVIGVVRNFNYATLHQPIEPLLFTMSPWEGQFAYISLRISENSVSQTMEGIRSTWEELHPEDPFDYFFLDQTFDSFYRREKAMGSVFFYFSLITVTIGCMGLFGLVSYSVQRRTKEIGIRKVLGASTRQIFLLISRNFALLILAAFVLAAPVAYYLMKRWLAEFAYTVSFGPVELLLSGLLIFLVAFVTIGYLTLKIARDNPVKSLRSE